MTRLFVEQLLVPLLAADRPEPELRYDEERHLNVTPDGLPFVEMGSVGGTSTETRIRTEADDFDQAGHEDGAALSTVTKVQSERDDFAIEAVALATETAVPREKGDFARELRLATVTAVGGEPDDDDLDARACGDTCVADDGILVSAPVLLRQ